MKKRCKYIYVIILFLTFISFKIDVYANKYLDGELVPDNYIINPMWEEYNNLSEEEKSSWEVIPEKYTYILDDGFVNYSNNGISLQGNIIASSIPSEFDLRNVNGKNYVSPLKSQWFLDLCWAFATYSSLESNMLLTHPELSYYQDLDQDGIYEDATHVLTFSERQLDYATANPSGNIENYYSHLFGRELGAGGNIYYAAGAFLFGFSPLESSFWGVYDVSKVPMSVSDIFNIDDINYMITETVDFPYVSSNSSDEYKTIIYNMIKEHIMNYGSVYFSASSPISECYDAENDMYFYNSQCGSHAMSIVGWDDNYGSNNQGAWIIKNSQAMHTGFDYYSMDFGYVNFYGIKNVKIKDWDNNYNMSNNPEVNIISQNNNYIYEIKYNKLSNNPELLKYISFYVYSQDSTFDVYVSDTGNEEDYRYIKTVTKDLSGLLTIEIEDVQLLSDSFLIKIISNNATILELYGVSAFTSYMYDIDSKFMEVSYSLDNNILSFDNKDIYVYVNTRNISIGEYLELNVYDSLNNDVTNMFDYNMLVVNNFSFGTITSKNYIPQDTYTFVVSYQDVSDQFSIELSTAEGIGDGGIGTEDDPFIISKLDDLLKINTYLSAHYQLVSDIDLSICKNIDSACYNDGAGWLPIGYDSSHPFMGSFDGNGHTISNLYINRSTSDYVGLFGYTENAVIKNLNLTNIYVSGNNNTGGLIGMAIDNKEISQISNITISGKIRGLGNLGGVVGTFDGNDLIISNCGNYSEVLGVIDSAASVGGIVGLLNSKNNNSDRLYNLGNIVGRTVGGLFGELAGSISRFNIVKSYNAGVVEGKAAGGIVGSSDSKIRVVDVYNSGNVSGITRSAGLFGRTRESYEIVNFYNVGKIFGDNSGELIAYNFNHSEEDNIYSNIYYLSNNLNVIVNSEDNEYVIANALSRDEFIIENSFVGFDFENVWEMKGNMTYPTLRDIPYYYVNNLNLDAESIILLKGESYQIDYTIIPSNASNTDIVFTTDNEDVAVVSDDGVITSVGDGSTTIHIGFVDNSYPIPLINVTTIGTENNPYIVSSVEDLIYINTNENTLSAYYVLNNDIDLSLCKEEGSICYDDGYGWIPIGGRFNGSFKGQFDGNGHTISNLYINREYMSNYMEVGLFGEINDAVIKNLNLLNVDVSASYFTGGLMGDATSTGQASISNVSVSGNINSLLNAGGIAGRTSGYSFINCSNYSTTSASKSGGIAAEVSFSDKDIISNLSNFGNIIGISSSGGIFGSVSGTKAIVSKVYNFGLVEASSIGGGIIGASSSLLIINDSFNSGNVVANNLSYSNVGGLAGNITGDSQINNVYNVGNILGNFTGAIVGNVKNCNLEINNGYYLSNNINAVGKGSMINYNNVQALTKDQFIVQSNFEGFDFNNIWEIKNQNAYPTLKWSPYYYVTSIQSSVSELELTVDDTYQIEYSVLPDNVNNKNVIFTSLDENIATVSETGLVTAVVSGETKIMITSADNSYPEILIDVVVKERIIPVESVSFNKKYLAIQLGDTIKLDYVINPLDATNKNVIFTSSNNNILSIDSVGNINGIKRGTVVVTITTEDGGFYDTMVVTVFPNVDFVKFTRDSMNITVGDRQKLDYVVNTDYVTDNSVSFISSNEDVIVIDSSGYIEALSAGSASITIRAMTDAGEKTDIIQIIVDELVELRSDIYNIDATEKKVFLPDKVTNTLLFENIYSSYSIIFDENSSYVGTGKKINIVNNKDIIKEYDVLVYGDVNGDGEIDIFDIMKMIYHEYTAPLYSGIYLEAFDYNHDGDKDIYDIMKVINNVFH